MRLLQVFNRYLHPGGEEKSVDRIFAHAAQRHEMHRCFFDSREWTGPDAPGKIGQACRLIYNPDARTRFESSVREHKPEAALFHNLYPVGSPSLSAAACAAKLPVIQYLHNFRPFCVSGTVFGRGQILAEALRGQWWREVRYGTWQGSMVKSALFALMLKHLHLRGWLRSVKAWIAISDFMRDRLVESGVPADRIHALRHSWDAMPEAPDVQDRGAYLFLGRLVEEKGVCPLLDAWRALRTQLGERTPMLHIAGEGPLDSVVRAHAGTNPSVRYFGLVDGAAKREQLQNCRAVIVPSTWWEPLGIVVYEAYDWRKPVLSARSGGLSETVQHGSTGLLHEPGDADAIVRSVMALEEMTSDRRTEMGEAGRAWLLRETNVGAWQDRFDEIVRGALLCRDSLKGPR